jgi:hypothetical protein
MDVNKPFIIASTSGFDQKPPADGKGSRRTLDQLRRCLMHDGK